MRTVLIGIVLAVAAVTFPTPAMSADPEIVADCTVGGVTSQCNTGWYRADVGISFLLPQNSSNPSGCADQSVTSDTTGTQFTCSVQVSGTQCCILTITIKRDATPPTVDSITPSRAPDSNGWYNHPVSFAVSGSDATSGLATCTTTTYAGPDSASAAVTGTCTDNAGNVSAPQTFFFQYDATPPSVWPHAARGPDVNGWYDHPVAVSFQGSDALSGIASCTSSTYSGPDSGAASVSGSCTDKAGNTASASFALRYDSTPLKLTALTAEPLDHGVSLAWKASKDAVAVTVSRVAGATAAKTVYRGKPRSAWKDVKLRNGVKYTYTVSAEDATGYTVDRRVTVRPSPPLIAPSPAARVHGGTTLRWRPVRKAAYYNVQLWHRGAKVLSVWPVGSRFLLPQAWTYLGRGERLVPGRYVWYVWPGFGPRARHRYGPLLGESAFVVVR